MDFSDDEFNAAFSVFGFIFFRVLAAAVRDLGAVGFVS